MAERKPIREMTDIERLRHCAADYGRYCISDGVFLLKIAKDFERLKELCLDKVEGRVNCPDNWMEWNKEVSAICKESEDNDD